MKKENIKELHELLLQNVREENEKECQETSSTIFNMNSKRNLILVAKESLKPKNLKHYNANNIIQPVKPFKISRTLDKKNKNIIQKREDTRNKRIFSDQQYLSFMLNDLKTISSSIRKKEKMINPSLNTNNISIQPNSKRGNKYDYNSYRQTRNRINKLNLNMNNNHSKMNDCNMVNLLNQIIGDINDDENYKYEKFITENNIN